MNNSAPIMDALVVGTMVLMLSVAPAYAYVDPGSGSVIVTTILGLFAAIGYTFRRYFYKLRRMFRKGDASADADRFSDKD
ncbi:hypothetical protein [Algirhabdus cladophorae]|uniref:hypothetical protein n=1 Tax=Algirhabdus cladophorae TaxID=3377108 RepID=UPI003B8494EC